MNYFRTLTTAGTLAAAALLGSGATAATLDFENLTERTVFTAGTDIGGGLSFTTDIVVEQAGFLQNAPVTEGFIGSNATLNDFRGSVTGIFARAVKSLTIGAGDVGFDQDTVTLTAFNAAGDTLGISSFTAAAAQFLTIEANGISSFTLSQPQKGGFDNITFETIAPVPVPASLPLLAAGLLGFGVLRSRNRAA